MMNVVLLVRRKKRFGNASCTGALKLEVGLVMDEIISLVLLCFSLLAIIPNIGL